MTFKKLVVVKWVIAFLSLSTLYSSETSSPPIVATYALRDNDVGEETLSNKELLLKQRLDRMLYDGFKKRDSVTAMALQRFIDICQYRDMDNARLPQDIKACMIKNQLLLKNGLPNPENVRLYALIKSKLPELNYDM